MLSQDFENRLKAQVDFPSPSRVATEIIALARDPDIEMSKVAQAISRDPAMTAKILRIANSAFYAQRRPSQNLRQALVIIGLNAALTLALSFSLVSSMRALRPVGIDYPRFWRRALLGATAARAFGESIKVGHAEDIFLAALLQDMAVLALDRASRDFYAKLPQPSSHADWVAYETEQLGRDHAGYSAMLLKSWNLPERICKTVEASHEPQKLDATSDEGRFARCVAGPTCRQAARHEPGDFHRGRHAHRQSDSGNRSAVRDQHPRRRGCREPDGRSARAARGAQPPCAPGSDHAAGNDERTADSYR